MNLPPDRAHIDTEKSNNNSLDLHTLSAHQCVNRIVEEDQAVINALKKASNDISQLIEAAKPGFCAGGRIVYFGAGTSGRLGVLDASEAPPTFHVEPGRIVGIIAGGDGSLRTSSEGKEDDPEGVLPELMKLKLTTKDTLIGIAAGGTTPYVRGGLEWAAQQEDAPLCAFLSCAEVSIPDGVAHMITLRTGPEVLTGSTRMKAGTATKLFLNTLSTTLMIQEGRVYRNLMVDVRATNDKLKDRAARILSTLLGLSRPDAFSQLEIASGELKTALVMSKNNSSATEAREELSRRTLADILDN